MPSTARLALIAAVAAASVMATGNLSAAAAQGSNPTPPPAKGTPPPTDDYTPPFPSARGVAPLQFAVTGLAKGYATIGAGRRVFAVCWQGGEPPYRVALGDQAGRPLVLEGNLQHHELVELSTPTYFTTGRYTIRLSDGAGDSVQGGFSVAPAGAIPASMDAPGSGVGADARSLMNAGVVWRYEAYLRVAPTAAPGSDADRLDSELCHRQ